MAPTLFLTQSVLAQAAQGGKSSISFFIMLGLMFLILYFLMIRPQQQRQKKHRAMLEALKKNDRVVTVGGLYAQVLNVKDDRIVASIADGVKVEIAKHSVQGVVEKA